MFQKLFQVTLVVFVVIFSVVVLAIIGSLLMSLISGRIMAGTGAGSGGISTFTYAITQRQMALMVVAASLIIGGCIVAARTKVKVPGEAEVAI